MKKICFLAAIILALLYIFTYFADFILCDECGNPYSIKAGEKFCSFCLNLNFIPNSNEIFLLLSLSLMIFYYYIFIPSATLNPLYKPPKF